LLPQAKPPSLRIYPARIAVTPVRFTPDPVQAKNVPIFRLKGSAAQYWRVSREGGESGAAAVVIHRVVLS